MHARHLLYTLSAFAVAFSTFAQQPADQPKDLVALRQSWTIAKAQAIAPIDTKYRVALEAMKLRYTRAGDLKAAIAVDQEVTSLVDSNTTPAAQSNPPSETVTKARTTNLEMSQDELTWEQGIQWCADHKMVMLSYADWTNERIRDKLNKMIGKKGIWIGLTYDFERLLWLDTDGSVVTKPTFNPSMGPPGMSAKSAGVHASFWAGAVILYDTKGDQKRHVIGVPKP